MFASCFVMQNIVFFLVLYARFFMYCTVNSRNCRLISERDLFHNMKSYLRDIW